MSIHGPIGRDRRRSNHSRRPRRRWRSARPPGTRHQQRATGARGGSLTWPLARAAADQQRSLRPREGVLEPPEVTPSARGGGGATTASTPTGENRAGPGKSRAMRDVAWRQLRCAAMMASGCDRVRARRAVAARAPRGGRPGSRRSDRRRCSWRRRRGRRPSTSRRRESTDACERKASAVLGEMCGTDRALGPKGLEFERRGGCAPSHCHESRRACQGSPYSPSGEGPEFEWQREDTALARITLREQLC